MQCYIDLYRTGAFRVHFDQQYRYVCPKFSSVGHFVQTVLMCDSVIPKLDRLERVFLQSIFYKSIIENVVSESDYYARSPITQCPQSSYVP